MYKYTDISEWAEAGI